MKILAVESSAIAASVAISQDSKLICELYLNQKLTHSQTLMPMLDQTVSLSGISLGEMDVLAVSHGPGSFTGLRIGISTIKGLSAATGKPCFGVSTLEAMAYNHLDYDGVVCACMDARCNQLYNALFMIKNGTVTRLCDDRAILLSDLKKELLSLNFSVLLVGDGANLCYNYMNGAVSCRMCAENVRYPHAFGICMCALTHLKAQPPIPAERLNPIYLRLPQAERELKNKTLR